MKSFVPGYEDDSDKSEPVWRATRRFTSEEMQRKISGRRIRRLSYIHDSKQFEAVVGEIEPRSGEPVVAILESEPDLFLVCTPNHAVARGLPILVGRDEVITVEEFEAA